MPLFKETKNIRYALKVNPYLYVGIGIILLIAILYLNKYICKLIIKMFKNRKKIFSKCFFTYLIFTISYSLLFYYFSTRFNFIYKNIYVFENRLSNWCYFIVVIALVIVFALTLLKRLKIDYFNSKICQNYDFLQRDIQFEKKDSFIQYKKNNKTAVVFTRGVDKNSAAGQRSINDALLLKSLGYDVWLCGFPSTNFLSNDIDDIKIIRWNLYKGKNIFKKYYSYMTKKHILNSIKLINKKIDLILIYSVLSIQQVKAIRNYSLKNNIPLLFDSVEFQNLSEQHVSSFFTYFLPNMYINKHAITKSNYVIAISKYLEDYYKAKKIFTIRLPFINRSTYEYKRLNYNDSSKIIFAYTGKPGKKDDLFGIIKSYSDLEEYEIAKSLLLIVGPDIKDLYRIGLPISLVKRIENNVLFLGRLPYIKMKNVYSICDFTVLLKKSSARHAKADFPSKISQSLANGVPVISNISSDLEDILINDYNSILFSDYSCSEMTKAFSKALTKSDDEINGLKRNALKTSRNKLSFTNGTIAFNEIIKKINKN